MPQVKLLEKIKWHYENSFTFDTLSNYCKIYDQLVLRNQHFDTLVFVVNQFVNLMQINKNIPKIIYVTSI